MGMRQRKRERTLGGAEHMPARRTMRVRYNLAEPKFPASDVLPDAYTWLLYVQDGVLMGDEGHISPPKRMTKDHLGRYVVCDYFKAFFDEPVGHPEALELWHEILDDKWSIDLDAQSA